MKVVGIVIDSAEYNDNDKIINLLTKDKVIPLLAKGIRKQNAKNRDACFEFSVLDAEYIVANNRNILTNSQFNRVYWKLFETYDGLIFLNFYKEACRKVLLEEELPALYKTIEKVMTLFDGGLTKENILKGMFMLFTNALFISGYDYKEYCASNGTSIDYKEFIKSDVPTLIIELKKMNYFFNFFTNTKLNSIDML